MVATAMKGVKFANWHGKMVATAMKGVKFANWQTCDKPL